MSRYALIFVIFLACTTPVFALPTMIRLGYPNCVSCHISPQGAGLLNPYGRGIDQAQSMIGGDYVPADWEWSKIINWNGRITQDFRTVMQQQIASTTDHPGTQLFRARWMYRNATELGEGWRITATLTGENTSANRPNMPYEGSNRVPLLYVSTALVSYRARKGVEFAVGRDQLPTGVNIADLSAFVRSRNRLGYYDSTTQLKAFFWTKRTQLTPYIFGPSGSERTGHHEAGGGSLAEFDIFGRGRSIAGLNLLRAFSATTDRSLIGPYARFGFGKWGILAEHDITNRSLKTGSLASFQQTATYGQIFWAAREWLVPSLVVERLRVGTPYLEKLNGVRLDVAARLSPQITLSGGPRLQQDVLTGRVTKGFTFQIAIKTVH